MHHPCNLTMFEK